MAADATYMRAYRARLAERGRCVTCRQPREPERRGYLHCAACAAGNAARTKRHRDRRDVTPVPDVLHAPWAVGQVRTALARGETAACLAQQWETTAAVVRRVIRAAKP